MRSSRTSELVSKDCVLEEGPKLRLRHRCPVMTTDLNQNGEFQVIHPGSSFSPPQHHSKSRRMDEYVTVTSFTNDDGFRPTPLSHQDHVHTTGRMISSKSMPIFPSSEDLSSTKTSDVMCSSQLNDSSIVFDSFGKLPLIGVDTRTSHKHILESHSMDDEGLHQQQFLSQENMMHPTSTSLLHPSLFLTKSGRDISPDVYVSHIFQYCLGYTPVHRSSLELLQSNLPSSLGVGNSNSCYANSNGTSCFFSTVSETQTANYCADVVEATRNGNLQLIRSLFASGKLLSCCNPFGESLLHMACRRGYTDLVRFFIEEAHVSPRLTDDGGRTPLHDALWHRDPQFDIVHILILHEPALLLCKDKRGFSPFTYSRAEHASLWIQFLWDRRDDIKTILERVEIKETCSSTHAVNGDHYCVSKPFRYKDMITLFFH